MAYFGLLSRSSVSASAILSEVPEDSSSARAGCLRRAAEGSIVTFNQELGRGLSICIS
jgi:hypothetical protein